MLAPVRVADNTATQNTLTFDGNTTDLKNIATQSFERKVVHKVQTEESVLRPYVMIESLTATSHWYTLMDKRDPEAFDAARPTINPRKSTFDAVSIWANPYRDDATIVPFVRETARISIDSALAEAMYRGYERLFDRTAISSMLVSVRTLDQSAWNTGVQATNVVKLPNDRIGGAFVTVGGNKVLGAPKRKTIEAVIKKFTQQNVSIKSEFYGLATPNMLSYLRDMTEMHNRDYIWSVMRPEFKETMFPYYGINWIKCTPEIAPGAYYPDKYLKVDGTTTASGDLVDAADVAGAANFDLSATNHEAIPIWTRDNCVVGEYPSLKQFSIIPVPYYRDTPVMLTTQWCGASRIQNVKTFVLLIPVG